MLIPSIFSKLFILLFIKPDINTVIALLPVMMLEFTISKVKRVEFLISGYFFVVAAVTVLKLKDFLVNAVYSGSGEVFISVTLILALIFSILSGIKGVVRGYNLVAVFFVLTFIFSVFGNIKQFTIPEVSFDFKKVMYDAVTITAFSPEILIVKKVPQYILISNMALGVAFLLTTSVLGSVSVTDPYPFYTVGTLAKISVFSRLDAVHSALWVMMGYFKGALLLNSAREKMR